MAQRPTSRLERFIGREYELARLRSLFSAAADGEGQLALISGEGGIGKTRLAVELARTPFPREPVVLWARCADGDGTPAFWPWLSMLRNVERTSRGTDDLRLDTANLAEVVAALSARSSRHPPPRQLSDPQQARSTLFEQACDFLAARASIRPLLLFFDDAQWADVASLRLLQHLSARANDMSLLACMMFREVEALERDDFRGFLSTINHHLWTHRIVLRGLSTTEGLTLLGDSLSPGVPHELQIAVHNKAGGNPFFLKELAQLLSVSDLSLDELPPLPPTMTAALEQEFRGLDSHTRAILEAASLVGSVFDPSLVARVVGSHVTDLESSFERAAGRQIIVPHPPHRYRFSHELIREALCARLSIGERSRLHAEIAQGLEQVDGPEREANTSAIAHHYYMAGQAVDAAKALAAAVAAGQFATNSLAFEEAVSQYRRARDLSAGSTLETRCEVLLLLGNAEALAGYSADSRRTFTQAAQAARTLGSPRHLSQAATGFKGLLSTFMPPDFDMVALLREARVSLPSTYPRLRVELASALGSALYFTEYQDEVSDCVREAVTVARTLGEPRLLALAVEAEMLSLWSPSSLDAFLASATQLEALGHTLHDPGVVFRGLIMRQSALLARGAIQESDESLGLALNTARSAPHPLLDWQATLLQGGRAQLRGNFKRSEELCEAATSLGQRVHDDSATHLRMIQNFQHARLFKDLRGWDAIVAAAIDAYPTVPGYRAGAALVYANTGQHALARTSLRYLEPLRTAPVHLNCLSLWYLTMLAETAFVLNELDWARSLHAILDPFGTQIVVAGWGVIVDGAVAHYLGLLAETMGQTLQARSHYEAALKLNQQLAAPALVGRTLFRYGQLLEHSDDADDRSRGRLFLAEARELFSSLDLSEAAQDATSSLSDLPAQLDARPLPPGGENAENMLRHEGDYWSLRYDGELVRIRHSLGLQYIAQLIAAEGRELHVLDIVTDGTCDSHTVVALSSSAGALLDPLARAQYRNRLNELEQDIELARDCNDLGQISRLQREREAISDELQASYSLGGRARSASTPVDRARVSVRNRITAALNAIKRHHESAWRHFYASVRTGRTCSYRPERSTTWLF